MEFFNNEIRVYIDPKEECKSYRKKLKEKNYFPIPTKLIYTPITHHEFADILKDRIVTDLPSIYPNTKLYWLKGNILFFQGLVGASATGILIEEMIALGVKEIIFVGLAGGIQSLNIGDKIIVSEALRFEGTSYHYLPSDIPSVPSKALTDKLYNYLMKRKHCEIGKVCSTDAPFRETHSFIENLRQKEVLAIEMEISAVLAIAHFRKIQASALVIISDTLKEGKWSEFQEEIFFKEFLSSIDILIDFFSNIS